MNGATVTESILAYNLLLKLQVGSIFMEVIIEIIIIIPNNERQPIPHPFTFLLVCFFALSLNKLYPHLGHVIAVLLT